MLAAEMQKSADKTVAAVSVIVTAAGPVTIVGKMLGRCRSSSSRSHTVGISQFLLEEREPKWLSPDSPLPRRCP
jgi:hypothetical protein